MADPLQNEHLASALHAQSLELGKQAQEFTMSADKYFAIATTIIVAAVTLSLTNKIPAALVALPFALGGVLLYAMQLFTERAARAGMKRALEEQLRKDFKYSFALVEDCLEIAVSQRRLSVAASTLLYSLALLAACIGAIIVAVSLSAKIGPVLIYAVSIAVGLLLLAVGLAFKELRQAESFAYRYATRTMGEANRSEAICGELGQEI